MIDYFTEKDTGAQRGPDTGQQVSWQAIWLGPNSRWCESTGCHVILPTGYQVSPFRMWIQTIRTQKPCRHILLSRGQEDCFRKGLMSTVNWPYVNSGAGNGGTAPRLQSSFVCSSECLVNAFHNLHSLGALLTLVKGVDQATSGFGLGAQSLVVHGIFT